MLLRGAYSAKYRAVHQDEVENLRDEEREQFNVKLEKTKELSRDTNRRRRALEQRRRDYEAEEEKKRREILAQRKKEIQEATEKFQRSNIVRPAKKKISNHHIDQKLINQRAKKIAVATSQYTPTSDANGQPYYPSVEEVLAMLQSDRAQVMERLTEDKPSPDVVHPQPSTENSGTSSSSGGGDGGEHVEDERYALEQERLRSEVIIRSEPKFAFDDQAQETTGILPTTMRKDSPSGSLTSVDSLDDVAEEIAEPSSGETQATSTSSVASIMRNPKKAKHGNQVSFNENVTFSDGLTGVLKTKDDITGMEKQTSFFEIPSKTNGQVIQNGVQYGQQSPVKTSVQQSTVPLEASTPNKYPYVTVTYAKSGEITNKTEMIPQASHTTSNMVNTNIYGTSNIHNVKEAHGYNNASTGYVPVGHHDDITFYDETKSTTAYPNPPTNYADLATGYPETTRNHPNAHPNVSTGYPSYPESTIGYPNTSTGFLTESAPNSRPNITTGYRNPATSFPYSTTAGYTSVTSPYSNADTKLFNDTCDPRHNATSDHSTLVQHHATASSPGVTTVYHATSYANTTPTSFHNVTPGYSNVTPGYSNVTPGYSNVTPGYSNVTPGYSNVTPGYSNVTPGYSNVTPGYSNVTPGYSNVTPGHSNVTPGYSNVTPGHSNVTPGYSNVTPGYSNVTGYSNTTVVHNKPYYTSSPSIYSTSNVLPCSSGSIVTSSSNNAKDNAKIFIDQATTYETNADVKYIGSQPHVTTNNVVPPPYTSGYSNVNQVVYPSGQITRYTPQQRQPDVTQIPFRQPFETGGLHNTMDSRHYGYHKDGGKDKDVTLDMMNGTAKDAPYDSNSNNKVDQRHQANELYDDTHFSSSINALRLRDSLEMNHELQHDGEDVVQDIALDTPLVAITKKDFLSKALSRTNDPTIQTTHNKLNKPSKVSATKPEVSENTENSSIRKLRPSTARHSSKTNTNPSAKDISASEKKGRIYTYKMDYKLDADLLNDVEDDDVNRHESTIDTNTGAANDPTTLTYGQNKAAGKNVNKPTVPPTKSDSSSKLVKKAGSNDGVVNKNGLPFKEHGYSDDVLKSVQADIERITMVPTQAVVDDQTTTTNTAVKRRNSNNGSRKTHTRKNSTNGSGRTRTNSNNKRLHKPNKDLTNSARRATHTSTINIQYSSKNSNNNNSPVTTKQLLSKDAPDMESRTVIPEPSSWANTFDRKQYKNRDGINILDKTPTDDDINKLWETVRTCLKHEQTHKAASDSVVNSIRRSRSESGAMINNHYLIDNQRCSPRGPGRPIINAFGPNTSEPRTGYVPFRRQNSLDGIERCGSSDSSTMPQRKGSLLGQRSSRSERKLTRNSNARPPINPQYIQTLGRPTSSTRGPQKSNTIKQEDSKLSYAEFQTIMQASSDLQARDGAENEQKRPQATIHQPIIMDKRREPSALSVEEKRLLESLDRLNERLKVQEATTGKLLGHRNTVNTPGGINANKILHQTSPNNTRFTNRSRQQKDHTNGSLLNRR